jgi:hypothetical protein
VNIPIIGVRVNPASVRVNQKYSRNGVTTHYLDVSQQMAFS